MPVVYKRIDIVELIHSAQCAVITAKYVDCFEETQMREESGTLLE